MFTPTMSTEVKLMEAQALNEAWQRLEERAYQEMEKEGYPREKVRMRYGMFARYGLQMSSWVTTLDIGRVNTIEDLDRLVTSFEKTYTSIYPVAARFPESGYAITAVFLEAIAETVKPVMRRYPLKDKKPARDASKGQRDVYHVGRWIKFNIWEMDSLDAGNLVEGPAIVEHPMTTLVIPPENYAEFDEHKVIWYRKK
ncbi:hypothetical protein ACFLWX_04440 [Chloroflexota bacterium]